MIELTPCRRSHIADLVSRLREREAVAFATLGEDPIARITEEVARSLYAYAAVYAGETAAIFGAKAPLTGSEAYLWLICSELCERHPITFLRSSRAVMELMLEKFDSVNGFVLCDFEKSMRWLEWLGCTFSDHGEVKLWDLKPLR